MLHCVGKFYLVDSGYANDTGFLAPFRSITYHLEEFRRRNDGPSGREEVFNYTHSSLRNVVERTFGIWKSRWHILKEGRQYPMWKQCLIPVACAVLHNFLHLANQDAECLHMYLHPEEDVHSEDSEEESDVNEDENDDEDEYEEEDEDDPSVPVPRERLLMGVLRDRMADQMHAAYCRSPWYRQ